MNYPNSPNSNSNLNTAIVSKIISNRTINLTERAFGYSLYEASSLKPLMPLSGKYLLGERVWEHPPTMEGTLQIGSLLGKGGYGEVYKIWKVSNPNQCFALKIPGAPLSITKGYILNEIHKLKTLNKPGNYHIPKIKFGFL